MGQLVTVAAELRVLRVAREAGGAVLKGGGFDAGGFDAGGFDVTASSVPTAALHVPVEARVVKA